MALQNGRFENLFGKKLIPLENPQMKFLASIGKEEICFIPRHSRGHKINPTNINFRANIDAMKQLGVTDIISVSAVGSLKKLRTRKICNSRPIHR